MNQVSETRRLVVTGRKKARYSTMEITIDTWPKSIAQERGLPEWSPLGAASVPDYDLIRKQRIENEL